MNRMMTIPCFVCLLAGLPAGAAAEDSYAAFPGCGTVQNRNNSHQFGMFNWLEYIVETHGVVDVCGQFIVAVDASVPGVADSSLWRTGLLYASARRQIMVPAYRRWQTNGTHFASGTIPNPTCCGGWWPTGNTVSFADVKSPVSSDPAYECSLLGGDYSWNGFECAYTPGSPIIIDAARDGYRLTSVDDGVWFDLNADGTPELVSWTRAGSDDAFLAMDRNGNGRIDDGSELFGNHTPARADRSEGTTSNGFEALKYLESPSYGRSVPDGQIDARDAAFAKLLLWRDLNHNGISEPEELQPLADADVVAIGTAYRNIGRRDRFGNEFRQMGRITWKDGDGVLFDIWLKWRP
ncbi:MAG TPA: hypothetical protein VMM79_02555 [Longimicrobiales bacterium]|nr:hypothetical protein [Longimicrobiales bacterium]